MEIMKHSNVLMRIVVFIMVQFNAWPQTIAEPLTIQSRPFFNANYLQIRTPCSYDTAHLREQITYITACIATFPGTCECDYHIPFVLWVFQPAPNAHSILWTLQKLPPRTLGCLMTRLNHQQAYSTVVVPVYTSIRMFVNIQIPAAVLKENSN